MAQDVFKPKGATKASKPDAGGGNTRNVPVFGIVKDNVDPTRSGRIKVYIADQPGTQDSTNSDSWQSVGFMSNFFGKVIPDAGDKGFGDYKANPSSYGEWHAPPDIGTTVVCVFINGDPNYGFYIGCIPEPDALQMVPAIGSSDNIIANGGEAESYGGAVRLPVTNINTNNADLANSPDYVSAPRPVHSYTASIMNQQGIIRDPIRGPISSSAQREAASRVGWGVSTPGRPIYEGGFDDESVASNLDASKAEQLRVVARRGGHSLVMDDGDIIGRDQLIRIRTALGHQILMSDDGQTLMILHSNGQSYIELGKEGTIDMYSTNSVNIRTQGDLNLHADNNINMHAMKDFNIQAKNFHVNTEEELRLRATTDIKAYAVSNFTVKAGSAVALASGGDSSMNAGGLAYVNGSKVNLNSGSASTQPQEVDIIPIVAQTDTLYDEKKGFMASPGKLLTIASRAPAHAPWANAGQGVDVKTDLNASSQLPAAPSAAAAATNAAAAPVAGTPVSPATAASAPTTPAVSGALDKNTTGAVLGTVAKSAAEGLASAAVTQGAAIVKSATGQATAAVGAFAQTATQLASSGVIKPGADTLVKGLVQSGSNIASSMASAVFTGQPGAQNLTSLVKNVSAQATSVVSNLQQAQTALTAVGALTGKEAPAQVAGLVNAAASVGLGPTVAAVKNIAGTVSNVAGAAGAITGALSGATGAAGALNAAAGVANAISGAAAGAAGALAGATGALKAIGAGSAAANLATTGVGGLGGIAGALTAMGKSAQVGLTGLLDQAKGVAGSAFDAIKNSFKSLEAGVPQNLTAIAKTAAAEAAEVAEQVDQTTGSLLDAGKALASVKDPLSGLAGVAGVASSVTGAIGSVSALASTAAGVVNTASGALNSITGAVNTASSALGSVSNITGAVNNTVSGITGAVTSATNAVGSITNAVKTATTTVGGITAVTGAVNSAAAQSNNVAKSIAGAVNSINSVAGAASTIAGVAGLKSLASAASQVQSGAAAATASTLASGLSNLPGGMKTVGAVLNNAVGAINAIPGAEKISGLIKDAQSAAMNGLALPKLPDGVNALAGLAAAGLPAGAAAQLKSAISSLSSGTGGSIKLPTISFNTTDRGSITSQITSVLGDPKIPMPNLIGEISNKVKSEAEKALKSGEEILKVNAEIRENTEKVLEARKAFYEAEASLPQGDPGIQAAFDKWLSIQNSPERKALYAKLDDLKDGVILNLAGAEGASATTSAAAASAGENGITGLIKSASSIGTDLLSKTGIGGVLDIANKVGSTLSTASLTTLASTATTALSSVKGQGSTAVKALIDTPSVAKSSQAINNSISGIIGSIPPVNGTGNG